MRPSQTWRQKTKDLTDGRGVDHVIEVAARHFDAIEYPLPDGGISRWSLLNRFIAEISVPALFSTQIRISGSRLAAGPIKRTWFEQ
jgi:hypothetical protein